MGLPSNPGATRSGSAILDDAPPSPRDRVYQKPTAPGDDTRSLLGSEEADQNDEGSDPSLQSGANKLLMSQAMLMQAINLRESVAPGSVPDPIKQWVAEQMNQVPLMAEQMSRQGQPGAMLSAIGQSGAVPPSGQSTFSPAMGGGGGMAGGMSRPGTSSAAGGQY